MKNVKLITILLIFICTELKSQETKELNLNFLLNCFTVDQTSTIENTSKRNFEYQGINNTIKGVKTLEFRKHNISLNLTYKIENGDCVYLQLVMQDVTLFYKIKKEILNLKPQFLKTEYNDNAVISIYRGAKFTYKIITDYLKGERVDLIIIEPN
jgi:hypothetical protein